MRLFVAFALDAEVQEAIHRWVRAWRQRGLEGRFVPPANYHITLQFLGEVHTQDVEDIRQAYRQAARDWQPLSTAIQGWGTFGRQDRQMLWTGPREDAGRLPAYMRQMGKALQGLHTARTGGKAQPHITVARQIRLPQYASPPEGPGIQALLDTVALYHSHRVQGRLVYTPIDSFFLEEETCT